MRRKLKKKSNNKKKFDGVDDCILGSLTVKKFSETYTGSPPVTSPPLHILLALYRKNFVPYPLVTDCNVRVPAIVKIENKVIAFLRGDCYS